MINDYDHRNFNFIVISILECLEDSCERKIELDEKFNKMIIQMKNKIYNICHHTCVNFIYYNKISLEECINNIKLITQKNLKFIFIQN